MKKNNTERKELLKNKEVENTLSNEEEGKVLESSLKEMPQKLANLKNGHILVTAVDENDNPIETPFQIDERTFNLYYKNSTKRKFKILQKKN